MATTKWKTAQMVVGLAILFNTGGTAAHPNTENELLPFTRQGAANLRATTSNPARLTNAPDENRPSSRPRIEAKTSRPRFYGETSILAGAIIEAELVLDLRWSFGVKQVRPSGTGLRLGLVFDWLHGDTDSGAYGLEAQVDWPRTQRTRVGFRAALSNGVGVGSASSGDGTMIMIGPRLQYRDAVLSLDGVFAVDEDDNGVGLLVGAGLGGRSGNYALVASVVGAAIYGIGLIFVFSQFSPH